MSGNIKDHQKAAERNIALAPSLGEVMIQSRVLMALRKRKLTPSHPLYQASIRILLREVPSLSRIRVERLHQSAQSAEIIAEAEQLVGDAIRARRITLQEALERVYPSTVRDYE